MKRVSLLHQILHHLTKEIRRDMRSYGVYNNYKTVEAERFEKI